MVLDPWPSLRTGVRSGGPILIRSPVFNPWHNVQIWGLFLDRWFSFDPDYGFPSGPVRDHDVGF